MFNIEDARDYFITGIILLIAIFLMISRSSDGVKSIRRISLAVYSYIEEPLAGARVYRQALRTNEELRRKNILLQDELSKLRSIQSENLAYKKMLSLRDSVDYPLTPVRVIGKNLSSLNNSLTIDAGSDNGVENGMAIVSGDGLVGRVILTTSGYSEVMPILSSLFKVSARIQGSRAFGLVQWDGSSYEEITMYYVPKTIQVDSGAVVETSGFSLEFPAHIPIGTVVRSTIDANTETQILSIKPAVSLFQLAEAFVIQKRLDSSLVSLRTLRSN